MTVPVPRMKPLTIIPAIDLKGGRCVRLRQGRAEEATVYSEDPVAMAQRWAAEGAEYLHVVDLDGAFEGRPVHAELIGRIAAGVGIPVEAGGGLRSDRDIEDILRRGVARAIVGTRACARPQDTAALVCRFGASLAIGIDARDGLVRIHGWVEGTQMPASELAAQVAGMGVETIIYTDTSKDGMLSGPNLGAVGALCRAVACRVIASGGVSSAADVGALRRLGAANLAGVIVGKALYEGRVTMAELKRAAVEPDA